jgi:hypothetical protein
MGLYQPQIIYPYNETVDASSSAVTFSLTIRGTQCIKYTIYLYDVATNTEQYTDTQTLGSTLYDGDDLDIDVDMSALGADSYYWKADLYYDSTHYITTDYYPFTASSPPSLTFSPSVPSTITSPSWQFIGSYTQAENIEVKYWEIRLYDSAVTQAQITAGTAEYLQTSGETWSNNIRYTFNGLISGSSYQIQGTGITQGDIAFSTVLTAFNVAYVVPVSSAQPIAVLNDDSSITINWGNIVSITGVVTGSSSYVAHYLYAGNYGLHLESGADVTFPLDFNAPFTMHWICTPEAGFTGDMGEINDTAGINYIKLGYDGAKFYLNINGNYYYGTPEVLSTNPYKLSIISDSITISFLTEEVV